jgi:hypothetical protein
MAGRRINTSPVTVPLSIRRWRGEIDDVFIIIDATGLWVAEVRNDRIAVQIVEALDPRNRQTRTLEEPL